LLKRLVFADRTARWLGRLVLIGVWQLSGVLSARLPTPWKTLQFIGSEWNRTYYGTFEWSWYNNELIRNLVESLRRAGIALTVVLVAGVIIGYAMGRFWRIQALLSDMVMVGIALPAFIWALLAVMWFGLQGWRGPVFVCIVSATPMLTVNVFQGALAVPRELRDMSDAYGVPFRRQFRQLVIPSMAGYVAAGFRIAILAGWGAVMLVEWFGNVAGAGHRARYWYDAANFNGLMGWGVIILMVVITVDRAVLERIVRRADRWRSGLVGLGAARKESGRTSIEKSGDPGPSSN
jgi:NitT/TauT family transport system permease protein